MTMTVVRVQKTGDTYTDVGTPAVIGACAYGTETGIVDYSRKERDTFGNITLIERGYSDVVRYKVEIATEDSGYVRDTLASLRAVPARYTGSNFLSVVNIIGYLQSFSITLDDYNTSSLTLEVEGEVHQ